MSGFRKGASRKRDEKRQEQRQVRCPECKAKKGQLCTGTNGKPRRSNHVQRVVTYIQRIVVGSR